jgi:hypothetical protein
VREAWTLLRSGTKAELVGARTAAAEHRGQTGDWKFARLPWVQTVRPDLEGTPGGLSIG